MIDEIINNINNSIGKNISLLNIKSIKLKLSDFSIYSFKPEPIVFHTKKLGINPKTLERK